MCLCIVCVNAFEMVLKKKKNGDVDLTPVAPNPNLSINAWQLILGNTITSYCSLFSLEIKTPLVFHLRLIFFVFLTPKNISKTKKKTEVAFVK